MRTKLLVLPSIVAALVSALASPVAAQRATYPPECTATVVKAIATPDTMRVRCVRDRARVDLFNAQTAFTKADATRTTAATTLAKAVSVEAAATLAYNAQFPPVVIPPVPPVVTQPPVVNNPAPLPGFVHPFAPPTSGTIFAEFPRDTVPTAYPAITRSYRIGANLQQALDTAKAGDELRVARGTRMVGQYTWSRCLSGWVVLRTDADDTVLGAPGTRMTQSRAAAISAAQVATAGTEPVLTIPGPGCRLRLVGLDITTTGAQSINYALVSIGANENTAAAQPHHIILDRVYVHPVATGTQQRCVRGDGKWIGVIDSWLGDCHAVGGDAQGFLVCNGEGPFLIQNSTLQGSHQSFMFGGCDPAVPNLVPSDIVIRGNHLMRPKSWRRIKNPDGSWTPQPGQWTAKTLAEFKNGRRALLEGNVLENSLSDAQVGYAILLKSSNQDGRATWSQSADITVRYNKLRCVGGVFNIAAAPEQWPATPAARITMYDNEADSVNAGPDCAGPGDALQQLGPLADVFFAHNLVINPQGRRSIMWDTSPSPRLTVYGNVMGGQYLLFGSNYGQGTGAITYYAPGSLITANALVQTDLTIGCGPLPAGNLCARTFAIPAGALSIANRPYGPDRAKLDAATARSVVAP